jgi:hypothetical protein
MKAEGARRAMADQIKNSGFKIQDWSLIDGKS